MFNTSETAKIGFEKKKKRDSNYLEFCQTIWCLKTITSELWKNLWWYDNWTRNLKKSLCNKKWVWLKISPFLVVWGQHQQKTLQVKTKASHLQNVIGYDLMENWIIWRPCFHLSKTFCQNWTEIPFSDWQWLFWGPKLTSKLDHMVNILFSNSNFNSPPSKSILWRFEGLLFAWLVLSFVGAVLKLLKEGKSLIRLICCSMLSNYHITFYILFKRLFCSSHVISSLVKHTEWTWLYSVNDRNNFYFTV